MTDYGIFMLDPAGIVTSWNPGARRIKGYEEFEILGEHFSKFYTEEDREAGLPQTVLETARREGKYEGEGWRVRKDGSRFWASVVVDRINDDKGKLIGFAKITRDMVGDDYGVHWLPTYVKDGSPEAKTIATFPPINRMVSQAEHPFPDVTVFRYDTMYVETGRYLRQMTHDVQIAGGKIEVRKFATPADIGALPESLVFNCTGLGSHDLFGDSDLHPIRGQLAILEPQPEVRYAYLGDGYMFPRADGIVLGGTFERDVWDPTPQPDDIARILAAHKRLFSAFRCTA